MNYNCDRTQNKTNSRMNILKKSEFTTLKFLYVHVRRWGELRHL